MTSMTVEEAQTRLPEVIRQLGSGDEVLITQDQRPVARLVAIHTPRPRPPITGVPKAGLYEGRLVVSSEFDDPLEELREFMP